MKPVLKCFPVLTFCFVTAGCMGLAKREAEFNPGYALAAPAAFEVLSVTNSTGTTFDFDITAELRKQLKLQLQEQQLDWHPSSAGRHLILDVEILDYIKGNAFNRWLTPGMGKTLLDVQCVITESESRTHVGKVKVLRTVDGGGLYSVGQWNAIFHTVAKDLVGELKTKLKPASK
jgi:hypothetical protein